MISPGRTGTDEPPGITALSLRPFQTPPRHVEQVAERNAHRQLVRCRAFRHAPTPRQMAVPPEFSTPSLLNHSPPFAHDGRHTGKTLRVVDRGRLAVKTKVRRKRRLEAWLALLAFERLEQRGFLAADVGAGADMKVCRSKSIPDPRMFLPSKPGFVRFAHRRFENGDRLLHELAANVVVADCRAHGISRR